MGNVVYSPQLVAVEVLQVAEFLDRRLRDDGGPRRRAGHCVDSRVAKRGWKRNIDCRHICAGFVPHSVGGCGFAFGTRLNWVR